MRMPVSATFVTSFPTKLISYKLITINRLMKMLI